MNPSESAASLPRLRQSTKVEMRCCCDPNIVLGSIELPSEAARVGNVIQLVVAIPLPGFYHFRGCFLRPISRFTNCYRCRESLADYRHEGIAIKSEEVPAYVLPYVVGFEIFHGPPPELPRPENLSPWDWDTHCDAIYHRSGDALLARRIAERGDMEAKIGQAERARAWVMNHGQYV